METRELTDDEMKTLELTAPRDLVGLLMSGATLSAATLQPWLPSLRHHVRAPRTSVALQTMMTTPAVVQRSATGGGRTPGAPGSFAAMKPSERAALMKADPAAYKRAREDELVRTDARSTAEATPEELERAFAGVERGKVKGGVLAVLKTRAPRLFERLAPVALIARIKGNPIDRGPGGSGPIAA